MSSRRQPAVAVPGGCTLRAWTVEDAAELVLSQRDPLIRRYSGRLIDDRAEALEAIQGWNRRWAAGLGAAWALRDDGQGSRSRHPGTAGDLLGAVQFGMVDEDLGTGSAGYWLLPHGRGRGLASAALARASAEVFTRLDWFRIELYHAVENERSCSVARRAGFAPEGVMRSAMRYPADGRRSDEHLHARLRTDSRPTAFS
jgi:ribosomal-protein-alanine N-acetyltransferase